MNQKQFEKIKTDHGFIAALDQSGGSTPKALKAYGVDEDQYSTEEEMFDLVHEMRTRIIKSRVFNSDRVIGAILFEQTMDRTIDGVYTGDYLAEKGIVPFLKIDKGLADETNGVQLMKPIPDLDSLLDRAVARNIFGTKMRSTVNAANAEGIKAVVEQQFEVAKQVIAKGLLPIVEPEVNITIEDKHEAEVILKEEIAKQLETLRDGEFVMLKLSLPSEDNLYLDFVNHPHVVRVVALSGGYSRQEANEILARNEGVIASFSRALASDLRADQSDEDFMIKLNEAIESIYTASL